MKYFFSFFLLVYFLSCQNSKKSPDVSSVSFLPDTALTVIDIADFTSEGTFSAFRRRLPDLRAAGDTLLCFKPIQPMSPEKSEAVWDYRLINPDYGTIIEWKDIVEEAHGSGFKIFLDWSADFTADDHKWRVQNSEFYLLQNSEAEKARLDFTNPEMQRAMLEEMKFWLREVDIDGFRVEKDFMNKEAFWQIAGAEFSTLKPFRLYVK